MNKGLIALGKITGTQNLTMYEQNECLETIEEELKRLDELDNGAYVSIHINRYNELCDKEDAFDALSKDDEKAKKLLSKEIEKNRAFETIKKHIGVIKGYVYTTDSQITESEYELLCEVLR